MRTHVLIAIAASFLLTSQVVVAEEPATTPATPPTTEPASPLVIPEAKMPAGYPAPGAVDEIVVKEYPAARVARVWRDDEVVTDNDAMFMALFKHIQKHDIAMTSPVQIEYPETTAAKPTTVPAPTLTGAPTTRPASMAFVYSDTTLGTIGQDDNVEVVDQPAITVVSIGVRGAQDAKQFHAALSKLETWLKDHPEYAVAGNARFLGYNSPFVPNLAKYGEVQLPVEK